jgi:hypothetical protein
MRVSSNCKRIGIVFTFKFRELIIIIFDFFKEKALRLFEFEIVLAALAAKKICLSYFQCGLSLFFS